MTQAGGFRWQCPSNIALIKYWGKHGNQLPANPSLSITLDTAHTITTLAYKPGSGLRFLFEGKENPAFSSRIEKFLKSLSFEEMPFLKDFELKLESENSFPHSSGIASSASGMGALALCLVSMEEELGLLKGNFMQRASHIARLGSGSACRSVYGNMALWGKTESIPGSSDQYAVVVNDNVNPAFSKIKDSILIISKGKKPVSSTAGHALMDGHAYAESRFTHAKDNLAKLLNVIQTDDWTRFGQIVEQEALSLHAMMMSSATPYLLMEPNTIAVIRAIWEKRAKENWPLYFTLDAGPNVHLLYPESIEKEVEVYINEELVVYCENNYWISDKIGNGPLNLKYGY
ncbi:MAG: diphosphomevalonate decarboxylase [Chitinophagales bacterium]